MGTSTEKLIVDYRLSFADKGKRTSICHSRFQQTKGSCRFRLVPTVFRVRNSRKLYRYRHETWKRGEMVKWRHGHENIAWRHGHGNK
jgi:hypothetical protein